MKICHVFVEHLLYNYFKHIYLKIQNYKYNHSWENITCLTFLWRIYELPSLLNERDICFAFMLIKLNTILFISFTLWVWSCKFNSFKREELLHKISLTTSLVRVCPKFNILEKPLSFVALSNALKMWNFNFSCKFSYIGNTSKMSTLLNILCFFLGKVVYFVLKSIWNTIFKKGKFPNM